MWQICHVAAIHSAFILFLPRRSIVRWLTGGRCR